MKILAQKCNKCGKVVLQHDRIESTDLITTNGSFLFMGDVLPCESGRPSLNLKDFNVSEEDGEYHYCPDCLVEEVREWVEKIKKRPPSKIPINHILPPGNKVEVCPFCHK